MASVLLLQLDGKVPNLALMRLAAHHRGLGDDVELRRTPTIGSVERRLGDAFDRVYASCIFEWTRPVAERLRRVYPDAIVGGTGWDMGLTLESVGIESKRLDYTDYPAWRQSIGFTQRGCRLKCSFCCVPRKEPDLFEENTIADIWRGETWPRELILLDNDFFGQERWRKHIDDIRAGKFKVCFNQGINARFLNDETAAAIASVDYRDDQMKVRRIYTAWDNRKDEPRLFAGLEALVKHGVKPDHIMVYILVGYDHKTKAGREHLTEDDFYRHRRLREFGCRPYPMPYVRTPELVGFQRWIVGGAYDKRIKWEDWRRARYEPRRLGGGDMPLFGESRFDIETGTRVDVVD